MTSTTIQNEETTYYVDESYIEIRNTNGTIQNETYFYANGKLLAMEDPSGKMFYYHPDHLGSTTLVTNQTGNVVEQEYYLPYGEVYQGGESSRFLYAGKERDNTGLDYLGARYYASIIFHFIQPDPIIQNIYDPQNLNRYAYTLNNPYKYVDPTGNAVWLPVAVGGVIGAADFAYQYYIADKGFGVAFSHGVTTGATTTGAIYASVLAGGAVLAGAATVSIGTAGSLITQKIDNPSISLTQALPEAAVSGLIDLATPAILQSLDAPGLISYGSKELLSKGTSQQNLKQFTSDLIVSGTSTIINEARESISGELGIKKLIDDELYYYTQPQTPIIPKSTGGGSFAPDPDDDNGNDGGGSGGGGTCGCGCIMSCDPNRPPP